MGLRWGLAGPGVAEDAGSSPDADAVFFSSRDFIISYKFHRRDANFTPLRTASRGKVFFSSNGFIINYKFHRRDANFTPPRTVDEGLVFFSSRNFIIN